MNAAITTYAPLDDEKLTADDIAAINAALAEDAFPITVEHLEAFCRCIGTRKEWRNSSAISRSTTNSHRSCVLRLACL